MVLMLDAPQSNFTGETLHSQRASEKLYREGATHQPSLMLYISDFIMRLLTKSPGIRFANFYDLNAYSGQLNGWQNHLKLSSTSSTGINETVLVLMTRFLFSSTTESVWQFNVNNLSSKFWNVSQYLCICVTRINLVLLAKANCRQHIQKSMNISYLWFEIKVILTLKFLKRLKVK